MTYTKATQFEITDSHIKLLNRLNVRWNDNICGAPEVSPKRPYGNSNLLYDMREILDWEYEPDEEELRELHKEMGTVLKICLSRGEISTGVYESEKYSNDWTKIE